MHTGTTLRPELHRIQYLPLIGHLQREFPKYAEKFVCFRAIHTGRFVIGLWMSRLFGQVAELLSFNRESDVTADDILSLRFNLTDHRRIAGIKSWVEQQFRAVREQALFQEQSERERYDYREYLKRKCPRMDPNDPRWLAVV